MMKLPIGCIDCGEVASRASNTGSREQFTERIQLPLADGSTARSDALLEDDEYRLDFIRTAIEAEVEMAMEKRVARKKAGSDPKR